MKPKWGLVWFLFLWGCGQAVREGGERVWYLKGNLLLTIEGGKHQILVEMYGQKHGFWVIEGRDPLLSGRLFWFLMTASGTNYFINDVQKEYLFFVDEKWAKLFLEILPCFFERDEADPQREKGWLTTHEKEGWQIVVKKRFVDGMPRIFLIEGNTQKIYVDLKKIERKPYDIPAYEHFPWREVRFFSEDGVWEVIYER